MTSQKRQFFKYTPTGPRDIHWGLFLNGTGKATIKPNDIYPPAGHPSSYMFQWETGRRLQEFQLLYISEGSGVFESENGGSKTLDAGSFVFIYPNEWHRYRPHPEKGWKEYWVSFDGNIIRNIFQNQYFPLKQATISAPLDDEIIEIYHKLEVLAQEEPTGYQSLASAYIFNLISKFQFLMHQSQNSNTEIEKKIKKAKILLLEKCEENIEVQQIASNVHMGYEHFRRAFKDITGLAPYQYHLDHKINRAKELLLMTTLSVKMISHRLNFENQYYFSRIFKNKTGFPPLQWKRQSSSKTKSEKKK